MPTTETRVIDGFTVECDLNAAGEIDCARLPDHYSGKDLGLVGRLNVDGTEWSASDGHGWFHDTFTTFEDAVTAVGNRRRREAYRRRTRLAEQAKRLRADADRIDQQLQSEARP